MIVGVLTTCHTQYTWDRSICIFLFNRTTLQVFVTYRTGTLYVRICCWTIVTDRHSWNVSTQRTFSLLFASILVNCAPSGEMRNCCTPHIKENFENFLIHRCNYILLSQVYCIWQVVQIPTIISNNPIFSVTFVNPAMWISFQYIFQTPQLGMFFKCTMEENPCALHLSEYHWRTFRTAGWGGQHFAIMCHFRRVVRNHKKHVEVRWARIGQSLNQMAIVNCDSVSPMNPHIRCAVAANSLGVNWQVCEAVHTLLYSVCA
jgi:hypothetical protein